MKIRLMTIDDYEAIYNLWLSCKGMGLNDLDDSKNGIEKYLNRNPDTCFVVEEKEEIIGSILVGHDGRRAYISHTAIKKEYRRKGIGKLLVERVLEVLKEKEINKVSLVVFKRNEDGNNFWQALGFNEREDIVYRDKVLREMERIYT